MIPRRPSALFRSRWTALLWAAGVIAMAVFTIGFGPPAGSNQANPIDVTGAPVSEADLKALKAVIEGAR